MRPRPRGTTIVELLVSIAIFSLLLTAAIQILFGGFGAWSRTLSKSDEENTVLVAMSKLQDRLCKTDADSLVLFADPGHPITTLPAVEDFDGSPAAAVSVLAGDDLMPLDPNGFTMWTRFEIWYMGPDPDLQCVTGQSLWVQEVTLAAPSSFPVPYRLATFTPKSTDHRVLTNLVSFAITAPLRSSLLSTSSTLVAYRDSPVTIQIQVKWNGRLITHEASSTMLDNSRLEPPLPTVP